jgi:DNA-binding NarL/FixJ family response regulator
LHCGFHPENPPVSEPGAVATGSRGQLESIRRYHDLTARELEVLELIVNGKSNKRIAAALQISVATVKTHVFSIMRKLGADDRTHAATTALRRGIVHFE